MAKLCSYPLSGSAVNFTADLRYALALLKSDKIDQSQKAALSLWCRATLLCITTRVRVDAKLSRFVAEYKYYAFRTSVLLELDKKYFDLLQFVNTSFMNMVCSYLNNTFGYHQELQQEEDMNRSILRRLLLEQWKDQLAKRLKYDHILQCVRRVLYRQKMQLYQLLKDLTDSIHLMNTQIDVSLFLRKDTVLTMNNATT